MASASVPNPGALRETPTGAVYVDADQTAEIRERPMASRGQLGVFGIENRPERQHDLALAQAATDDAERPRTMSDRGPFAIFPAHQLDDVAIRRDSSGRLDDHVAEPSGEQLLEQLERGVVSDPIAERDLVDVDVTPGPFLLVDDLEMGRLAAKLADVPECRLEPLVVAAGRRRGRSCRRPRGEAASWRATRRRPGSE